MSRLVKECSLKDLTNLRNLIIENPDLPLLIFCGEEAWNEDYQYSQAYASEGEVQEITLYGEVWLDRDEYEEALSDDLASEEEYKHLSDKEYDEMIKKKVAETEFIEAIVIYVG